MKVWNLRFNRQGHDLPWELEDESGKVVANFPTKHEALQRCPGYCADRYADAGDPVSLRVHLVNGRFQEERTYPRSADPRRTKGLG